MKKHVCKMIIGGVVSESVFADYVQIRIRARFRRSTLLTARFRDQSEFVGFLRFIHGAGWIIISCKLRLK